MTSGPQSSEREKDPNQQMFVRKTRFRDDKCSYVDVIQTSGSSLTSSHLNLYTTTQARNRRRVIIVIIFIVVVNTLYREKRKRYWRKKLESWSWNDDRTCLSLESNVPWILDGQCGSDSASSSFSSVLSSHRCNLCGDHPSAVYLREIRDEIQSRFQKTCGGPNNIIVYGASLGKKYEKKIQDETFLGTHGQNVMKMEALQNEQKDQESQIHTCMFQFTSNYTGKIHEHSADGSQVLIVLDTKKLPYKNHRRNTKLLKMNPGLIFPWAEKIIWQDSKLLNSQSEYRLPIDYHAHFNRTVNRHGTCVSFVALPFHKSSVKNPKRGDTSVTLSGHCGAIVAASWRRPSVSDDLDVVMFQCQLYERMFQLNPESIGSQKKSWEIFHHNTLIDSAFIVWDMRKDKCRNFNGKLGCSWLDEISCLSDRDQVSFPRVVASSGLELYSAQNSTLSIANETGIQIDSLNDRIFVNSENDTMMHIAKSSCHWYFKSFSRCIANGMNDSSAHENIKHLQETRTEDSPVRVAVIIAGTLKRFVFQSMVKNFIEPLSQNGGANPLVSADFYISLTTAPTKAYRSNNGYMDYAQADPIFQGSNCLSMVEHTIRTKVPVEKRISVGNVVIKESIDIDSELFLQEKRKEATLKYPEEDPDLRFPIFDIRNDLIAIRTADANRNLLRMHLAIQHLWESAKMAEKEELFQYDYVIFARDDSLWLEPFDLHPFINQPDDDIYVPSCDARKISLDTNEINDHILISRRRKADLFGFYYSKLFQTDMNACMNRLSYEVKQNGKRGCNSEMILKWILDENEVKVRKVGQSLVPFQRSVNLMLPDGSHQLCFHKFCQSHENPLVFHFLRRKHPPLCSVLFENTWRSWFYTVKLAFFNTIIHDGSFWLQMELALFFCVTVLIVKSRSTLFSKRPAKIDNKAQ